MKNINLFLDDIRIPGMAHNAVKGLGLDYSQTDKWVIARDYFEFVYLVDNYFDQIKLISFDHDLACVENGIEYTGKSAADYLINYCLDHGKKMTDWYVHSDNTSGKNNIIGAITSYLKNVEGRDMSDFRYFHSGIVNNQPI